MLICPFCKEITKIIGNCDDLGEKITCDVCFESPVLYHEEIHCENPDDDYYIFYLDIA